MNKLREKLDATLYKYDIDVCRLFAVMCVCGVVGCGLNMIVIMCLQRRLHVDLEIVLLLFMGRAFWNHKSWPRIVTLVFSWCGLAIAPIFLVFVGLGKTVLFESLTFHYYGVDVSELSERMAVVVFTVTIVAFLLNAICLALLHSGKIRAEIRDASQSQDTAASSAVNKILYVVIVAASLAYAVFSTTEQIAVSKENTRLTLSVSSSSSDGTNTYFRVNSTLIVYPSEYGTTHISDNGKLTFHYNDGKSIEIKKHTKHTLRDDGTVTEEPWDGKTIVDEKKRDRQHDF